MYHYSTEKLALLQPGNMGMLLKAKEAIDQAISATDAITYDKALSLTSFCDSWQRLACLDYFVEQGFYVKVQGMSSATQHQILQRRQRPL